MEVKRTFSYTTNILLAIIAYFNFERSEVHAQTPKDLELRIIMPDRREWNTPMNLAVNNQLQSEARRNQIGYKLITLGRSPKDIFEMFCDDILANNVNTLVFLHISDDQKSEMLRDYMMNVITQIGIPTMYWNPTFSEAVQTNEDNRLLPVSPTLYHQSQAIMDILHLYNWTHVTMVSTTEVNHRDFVDSMARLINENNDYKGFPRNPSMKIIQSMVYPVNESLRRQEPEDIQRFLEKENHEDSRIYILHAQGGRAKSILEAAEASGLMEAPYLWLLTALSVRSISSRTTIPKGVFGISYRGEYKSGDEIYAAANTTKNAIKAWIDTMHDLKQSGIAVESLRPNVTCSDIGSPWKTGDDVYNALRSSVVRLNEEYPLEFTKNGMNKYVNLNVLNVQPYKTDNPRYKKYGSWINVGRWHPVVKTVGTTTTTQMELKMKGIYWPAGRPQPPKGKPEKRFFRIATLEEDPYVMYKDPDIKSGLCMTSAVPCRLVYQPKLHGNDSTVVNGTVQRCCIGLSIDLLNILSKRMNFDFDLFEAPDRKAGVQNEITGGWNGLIKVLLDKEADMVITALQITPRRSSAITFSMPYLETGTTIVVSLRKGAISPTAVLEPYDYPSWCLILVFSVHSIGASIFIFEWLSPKGLDQGKTPIREHTFSLFRSFWLIWAMLFGASVSADNPRGVSSRFLANVWALFALVFLASYTANLAAFMITKTVYYDLSGIKDWRLTNPHSHKPPFKFATVPNGSTEENLRQNHPEMFQYMKTYNKPSVKESIKALKNGDIQAFIYDATPLEYQVGIDEQCNLISVGKWYAMTGYSVGLQNGSNELAEEVNAIILDLQEYGEMDRLRKFWLSGACHSDKKIGQSSHQLGILNFTSAFILLASGIILGCMLLIFEHMYFRFGRKVLKKYDKCGCCALVSLSMGKSLTFEQSVMEAIDFTKKHRCKDPICETQLWKVKHQLDIALLRVEKLNKEIRSRNVKSANNILAIEDKDRTEADVVDLKTKEAEAENDRRSNPPSYTADDSDQIVPYNSGLSVGEETHNNGNTDRLHDRSMRRSPSYNQAVSPEDGSTVTNQNNEDSSTKYSDGKAYRRVKSDDGYV